ncbi:MAG: glycosyltransferase [Thermoleophilia bacterium]
MARTVALLGCPEDRAVVLRLGVDCSSIPFVPRRWTPGSPVRVLVAGSFREKKGIPDAILGCGAVLRTGTEVEVTLVGDGQDEEGRRERERIVRAIKESGLGPRVHMMGYQPFDELMRLAYSHHVFLAPSRLAANGDSEGGAPVTLIQMAASGMPVVSTTHCDIPFVLHESSHRFLAPEGQPGVLAEKICDLLASDWTGLTRRNRELTEAEANSVTQGQRLAELYDNAVRGVR